MSRFDELNALDVSEFVEKKGKFNYLSWSSAWEQFKKACPDATFRIIRNNDGFPYFKENNQVMCMTEITVEGETLMMWLPCMDNKNNAIDNPSMFEINTTLMRCLTKNMALFGLGLFVYKGEDLPAGTTQEQSLQGTISDSSAKSLKLMMKEIDTREPGYFEEICKKYNIKTLAEVKKTQYRDISFELNNKLESMEVK